MAVKADAEFGVGLGVDDQATPQIEKSGAAADKTAKSYMGMSGALITANQALELAKKAWEALQMTVGKSIAAFEAAEKVQTKLKVALAANGEFSKIALKGWNDYADQVAKTSTVDDDQVRALIAKSKAMGMSDQRTRQLIDTAIDLSAVFDGDVDAAFQSLAGTLNGVVGRGLVQADGRLKGLTDTQNKNGRAIELLQQKYKGFGKALADTAAGAKIQANNAFESIFKEIGIVLNDAFDFKALYQSSRDFFIGIQDFIKTLRPMAKELGVIFKAIGDAVSQIDFTEIAANAQAIAIPLATLAAINLAPFVVTVAAAAAEFVAMAVAVTTVVLGLDILLRNMDKLPQVADLFANAFLLAFSKISEGLLELVRFILMQVQSVVIKIGEMAEGTELAGKMAKLSESIGGAFDTMTEEIEFQKKATERFLKDLEKSAEGLDLGLAGALKKQLDNLIKNFKDAYAKLKIKQDTEQAPPNAPRGNMGEQAKLPELFSSQDVALISQMFGTGAGSFSAAASSMAAVPLGMLQAANIILDAVIKIINIIPEILNKVAQIFKMLEELPQRITDALNSIMRNWTSLTRNIWQNISKAMNSLMDGLIEMAEELPDAIMNSMKEFPDLMIRMMERLPDIVERMAYEFGEAMPEIAFTFIKSIIGNLPRLYIQFYVMIIKLAVAFVRGVLQGLRDGFKNIFGKLEMPDEIEDIPEKIMNGWKDLGGNIQREATNLFKVMDLNQKARGQDLADKISDSIRSATTYFENRAKSLWDQLKAIWKWIFERLEALWSGLREIWLAVFNMFQELYNFFETIFRAIWEEVIKPIVDMMVTGFQTLWESIIKPIVDKMVDTFQMIWETIIKPIVDKIVDGLTTIWDFVKTQIIDQLVGGLQAVWNWVKDNIVTPLSGMGTKISDGFKAGFTATFWSDLGGKIWGGFKTAADGATTTINGYGAKFWDGMKAKIDGATDSFKGIGNKIWDAAMERIKSWPNTISGVGSDIWDAAMDRISAWPNTIGKVGKDIWDAAMERIKDWPNTIAGTGKKMWDGFANALYDAWDWLVEFFGSLLPSGGGGGGGGVLPFNQGGIVRASYAAAGMVVPMKPRGVDTVPVMAEPGEAFVTRRSTQANRPLIDFMNQNPGARVPTGANVTINIEAKTLDMRELDRIMPRIEKGIRRATTDGRKIIDTRGTRSTD